MKMHCLDYFKFGPHASKHLQSANMTFFLNQKFSRTSPASVIDREWLIKYITISDTSLKKEVDRFA